MTMHREELLETARDMLEIAREACLLNPDTLSHPDRSARANDVFEAVSKYLDDDTKYPNSRFNNQDEMTAALIVLAASDEDTYRSVVQFSYKNFAGDLSTVEGISHLYCICRDLGDDHNLCLKTDGPLPILANEGYFPSFVIGACPQSLLEAIRPLAESAVRPAGPPI